MNEERGDSVNMSDVVIKSTENGPNLVRVDRIVVQVLAPVRLIHPHAFFDRTQKKNG